jgi:probable phosphoglycerate mutase
LPPDQRPNVVLCSPYLRAQSTANAVHAGAELATDFSELVIDERSREKEFGILDRLTRLGIEQRHPELAAAETGWEVVLQTPGRRKLVRRHLAAPERPRHHQPALCRKRVLVVAHQVVVLCMRYLLENMDEARILAIDAEGDVANCAVTEV